MRQACDCSSSQNRTPTNTGLTGVSSPLKVNSSCAAPEVVRSDSFSKCTSRVPATQRSCVKYEWAWSKKAWKCYELGADAQHRQTSEPNLQFTCHEAYAELQDLQSSKGVVSVCVAICKVGQYTRTCHEHSPGQQRST